SWPSDRVTTCLCWRARRESRGSPRSTSASVSPARRPSQIRLRFAELTEGLLEHLAWLGSEHEQSPVEQEARDPGDADGNGLRGQAVYTIAIGVAGQNLVHLGSVEPGLDGQGSQLVRVADVPALGPVGVHEPIVHCRVQAALAGQLGHA